MGRHLAVGCLAQRASRPSRGPRAPPPPLGDGGPGERDRHREADRVDCVRIVHLTEACDDDTVHLITHAMTTAATVHEARCTEAIHAALAGRGLVPATHLVDAAYVDAEFLVRSREDHGIELVGPPRPSPVWGKARSRAATRPTVRGRLGRGAGPLPAREAVLGLEAVRRPGRGLRPGQVRRGRLRRLPGAAPVHAPGASPAACGCTRGPSTRRSRPPGNGSRPRRAGAATAGGPGSRAPCPGVCAFGLRRGRYCGLARTRLQHVATAAAIDLQRLAAWFRAAPRAATRTSRFAALAAA